LKQIEDEKMKKLEEEEKRFTEEEQKINKNPNHKSKRWVTKKNDIESFIRVDLSIAKDNDAQSRKQMTKSRKEVIDLAKKTLEVNKAKKEEELAIKNQMAYEKRRNTRLMKIKERTDALKLPSGDSPEHKKPNFVAYSPPPSVLVKKSFQEELDKRQEETMKMIEEKFNKFSDIIQKNMTSDHKVRRNKRSEPSIVKPLIIPHHSSQFPFSTCMTCTNPSVLPTSQPVQQQVITSWIQPQQTQQQYQQPCQQPPSQSSWIQPQQTQQQYQQPCQQPPSQSSWIQPQQTQQQYQQPCQQPPSQSSWIQPQQTQQQNPQFQQPTLQSSWIQPQQIQQQYRQPLQHQSLVTYNVQSQPYTATQPTTSQQPTLQPYWTQQQQNSLQSSQLPQPSCPQTQQQPQISGIQSSSQSQSHLPPEWALQQPSQQPQQQSCYVQHSGQQQGIGSLGAYYSQQY